MFTIATRQSSGHIGRDSITRNRSAHFDAALFAPDSTMTLAHHSAGAGWPSVTKAVRLRRENIEINAGNVTRMTIGASIMPDTTTTANGFCTLLERTPITVRFLTRTLREVIQRLRLRV